MAHNKGPQFCWGCPAKLRRGNPNYRHTSPGNSWAYLFRIPETYQLQEGDPEPLKQRDEHRYFARWQKRQQGETLDHILETCQHVVVGHLPVLCHHSLVEQQQNGEPWRICSRMMQVTQHVTDCPFLFAFTVALHVFYRNPGACARGGRVFVLLYKREEAASGPQIL